MELLWFILIGLCAGWLAGQIMKTDTSGIVGNLVVGVIGSLFGGLLFSLVGLAPIGRLGSLIMATVGAIVLIALLRAIKKRG